MSSHWQTCQDHERLLFVGIDSSGTYIVIDLNHIFDRANELVVAMNAAAGKSWIEQNPALIGLVKWALVMTVAFYVMVVRLDDKMAAFVAEVNFRFDHERQISREEAKLIADTQEIIHKEIDRHFDDDDKKFSELYKKLDKLKSIVDRRRDYLKLPSSVE
jgi:hypothetical protein